MFIKVGNQTFTSLSVFERNKQMIDLVCYCFGYSREDIERDVLANGRSLIMEKIVAAKKYGSCQCNTKNPRGQ